MMLKTVKPGLTLVSTIIAVIFSQSSGANSDMSSFSATDGPHALFISQDYHLHQFVPFQSSWADQDLTVASNGVLPLAKSPVSSYMGTFGQIAAYFLSSDYHVHRYLRTPGGVWFDQDLTSASGGVPVYPRTGLSSYTIADGDHLHYIGSDGHAHQLYCASGSSAWQDSDLTAIASSISAFGVLPASGPITSFAANPNSSVGQHIFYVTFDQHVHHIDVEATWSNQDLSAMTSATPALLGGGLASIILSTGSYVYYIGTDQHVHQLSYNNSNAAWYHQDLTLATGGILAIKDSALSSYATADALHIHFVGGDNHLHQYQYNGTWRDLDLTVLSNGATPMGSSPVSGMAKNSLGSAGQHIFYVSPDLHVHHTDFEATFVDQDLMSFAPSFRGIQFADVVGSGQPAAIAITRTGLKAVQQGMESVSVFNYSDWLRPSLYSYWMFLDGPIELWTNNPYYGSLGLLPVYFADVTGDKKADAIVVNPDGITVRRSNGTSFAGNELWLSAGAINLASIDKGFYFADVDGDGKADLILVDSAIGIRVGLSDGSKFGPLRSWTTGPYYGSVPPCARSSYAPCYGSTRDPVYFADVDGDGKADAIVVNPGGITVRRSSAQGVLSAGHTVALGAFGPNESWFPSPPSDCGVFFGDVDGDHRADLILSCSDGWYYGLSNGTQFGSRPKPGTLLPPLTRFGLTRWGSGTMPSAYFGTVGTYVSTYQGAVQPIAVDVDQISVSGVGPYSGGTAVGARGRGSLSGYGPFLGDVGSYLGSPSLAEPGQP